MIKKSLLLFTFSILLMSGFAANTLGRDEDPVMKIHDTIVAPGEMLLQIDALHFTGDNGMVSAITLKIDVDTNLIQFINIQNQTLVGSWLANYNYQQNEISIVYTAFSGSGYDIDGKLLDLHIYYYGGFSAPLHFKPGSEVSNVNLATIDVDWQDGLITQSSSVGVVNQDSLGVHYGTDFMMPVVAGGSGYDMVNETFLRVEYDTLLLQYQGITESLLSGVDVVDSNAVLTMHWVDNNNPVDLTSADTLFFMNFKLIGDTTTITGFLPGSKVYNIGQVVASDFIDGKISPDFYVETINEPDTGGVSTGAGYYLEGDTVTLVAIPAAGFHFEHWTQYGSVVSDDSVYVFIKQPANDTLTAHFTPNTYYLSLEADPPEGGTVTGEGIYFYGEQVTVMATSNIGYDFVCWFNGTDTVSFAPVYSFSMPMADDTLTALFDIQSFSITAVPNNINYGSTSGGGIYNYGDTATVVATPFENYKFVVWTENGQPVSYDSSYSFFVDVDRDLFANFQYDAVCSAPVGLFVDSLSDSTAMLHWVPSGEESEWDLIWGEYGFDTLSGGNLVEGLTDTQYFLTNLDPGTVYDFYVRAVCTDEEHSVWAGPYTFTTWYVGVEEVDDASKVILFPNPATNLLTVNMSEMKIKNSVNYRIVNLTGIEVIHSKLSVVDQFSVNIGNLPKGIYFIQFNVDGKQVSKTFVKR